MANVEDVENPMLLVKVPLPHGVHAMEPSDNYIPIGHEVLVEVVGSAIVPAVQS